ncbi:MAG: hypothetical protein ACREYE_22750 [Gammaproteobacteria bacterium]
MISWQMMAALSIALAFHPLVLRVATAMMVEAQVPYAQAFRIVAIEYAASGVVLTALSFIKLTGRTTALILAAVVLVAVGATLVGKWLSFANGDQVGVGNGVLIQFMQVPLVIPLLIGVSFFFDATT